MLTEDLDVSVYQTPSALAWPGMGKRGFQSIKEEHGEVMSPATPPLSHGAADVTPEEEMEEVKTEEDSNGMGVARRDPLQAATPEHITRAAAGLDLTISSIRARLESKSIVFKGIVVLTFCCCCCCRCCGVVLGIV